tara:strand:- start:64 stop:336 length:273 start_codon:yes stop_codon:yes gene_type:complete
MKQSAIVGFALGAAVALALVLVVTVALRIDSPVTEEPHPVANNTDEAATPAADDQLSKQVSASAGSGAANASPEEARHVLADIQSEFGKP